MTTNDLINEGIGLFNAKKYTEAIQKLNQALDSIADKAGNLQQQNNAQFWLGRCYLEQALQSKDTALFDQAREHHQAQLTLAKRLGGDNGIQSQVYAQHSLGRCYFEQALQTKDTALFDRAREHRQAQLTLAKQLGGDNGIQEQIYAQSWLGRCYLEQALQTKDTALFDRAREHHQAQLTLAKQLGGDNGIQEQANAQSWLGRCYLEQALQSKDTALFDRAREHFQKRLRLALTEKLDGDNGIQEQANAQSWLGRCYLEQALQTKETALFDQAREHFQQYLALAKRLDGDNSIQEQVYAQYWLGHCYLEQAKGASSQAKGEKIQFSQNHFFQALTLLDRINDQAFKKKAMSAIKSRLRALDFLAEEYETYFNNKQEYIQEQLPEYLDDRLKENLASILAVLSISPIEFDKPLAHYTSPAVCEKLLGIGQKQENQAGIVSSKMRMNSSTYMNDPYEGRSLSDFLGIYEAALENLAECSPRHAFFTCFSARINDLNQFRLYGKVGNTEASGCCLVFNKNGDWIQEPEISASYRHLNRQSGSVGDDMQEAAETQIPSENLPLYQIAYIFYREEYTQDDEYDVMKRTDKNFGVRLKPISNNKKWHTVRTKQLQTALNKLRKYFQGAAQDKEKSQENQAALEYIRYLFKDYAFRDEEEFRLLKIEESGSDKVQYCHITNTAFLEYGDICGKLDEVILGTNYERTPDRLKVEVFRHLLKRKKPNIKVSHSSLPINPAGR